MNITSKSDCIGATCSGRLHFTKTFSKLKSCLKNCTFSLPYFFMEHASARRCLFSVQSLDLPFRVKCIARILQVSHQNPVAPTEFAVHPQNHICTYSEELGHCYKNWLVVNWTLKNNIQWNLNRKSNILTQENAFENIVCEMAIIWFRPQCFKL